MTDLGFPIREGLQGIFALRFHDHVVLHTGRREVGNSLVFTQCHEALRCSLMTMRHYGVVGKSHCVHRRKIYTSRLIPQSKDIRRFLLCLMMIGASEVIVWQSDVITQVTTDEVFRYEREPQQPGDNVAERNAEGALRSE